jgi:hypothetical protein
LLLIGSVHQTQWFKGNFMATMTIRAVAGGFLGALLTMPACAGLVFNGNFELPNLGDTGSYYAVGSSAVTGWTVVGTGGVTIHHVNQISLLWQGNNSQFMDLTGNTGGGGVQTSLATQIGQNYLISFDAVNGSRWFNSGQQNVPYFGPVLTVQASGGALETYSSAADLPPGNLPVPPVGNLLPVVLNYQFTANSTITTLTIMDVTGRDSNAGWIDNVQISAVPEPTTMIAGALLLLPFGASAIRILRRNRQA